MNVVIIDDEKILSSHIAKKLKKNNYNTKLLHSFQEYKNYNLEGTDLILLDISLWDGTGYDILKDISKKPILKNIVIIMISGLSDTESKVMWLDLGADDYIVKPFSSDELLARIRANTRKIDSWKDKIIEFKGVLFDVQTRKVSLYWEELNLSKKEKQIFEFFLNNKNRLITKKELLDRFWTEKTFESSDNIINVTIFNIRKKVWPDIEIETMNKEWYILQE